MNISDWQIKNKVVLSFNTILLGAVFISCIFWLGKYVPRSNFVALFLGVLLVTILDVLAFFLVKKQPKLLLFFVGVSLVARCCLIFVFPAWSEDIYRFLWDGHLWQLGLHPFEQTPVYLIENQILTDEISCDLFAKMNSPAYFSIYPPVCQAVFGSAMFLFPKNIFAATVCIKIFLLCCEFGSIYLIIKLLKKYRLPVSNVLLYALHPLPILEICGNAHFEGAMIFFLLLSIYGYSTANLSLSRLTFSTFSLALSVASKLLPLMFVPVLFFYLKGKNKFYFISILLLGLFITFIPIFSPILIQNFFDSLNLYFQKFEFNASVFYLSRSVGHYFLHYDPVLFMGPILSILVVFIILGISWQRELSQLRLLETMLIVSSLHLFFATIVHPWYVTMPLFLSIFTRWRFPFIWAFVIFLTYISYANSPFRENLWVVILEYMTVFCYIIYELLLKNRSLKKI